MTTYRTPEVRLPFCFTDAVEPVTADRASHDRVARSSEPVTIQKVTPADPSSPATAHIECGGEHLDPEPRTARWRVDHHGLIVYGNIDRRICNSDWSSRHIPWNLIHPEDRACVREEWSRVMMNRPPLFVMRFRLLRSNGEYVGVLHQGKIFVCQEAEDIEPKFCGYKGTTTPVL